MTFYDKPEAENRTLPNNATKILAVEEGIKNRENTKPRQNRIFKKESIHKVGHSTWTTLDFGFFEWMETCPRLYENNQRKKIIIKNINKEH